VSSGRAHALMYCRCSSSAAAQSSFDDTMWYPVQLEGSMKVRHVARRPLPLPDCTCPVALHLGLAPMACGPLAQAWPHHLDVRVFRISGFLQNLLVFV
jgi:hypothetical protein